MATVIRRGRLRVMVYSRDHPPPHAHLLCANGQAKILIGNEGRYPELIWNQGLSRRELAVGLAVIDDRRESILAAWKQIHGRT